MSDNKTQAEPTKAQRAQGVVARLSEPGITAGPKSGEFQVQASEVTGQYLWLARGKNTPDALDSDALVKRLAGKSTDILDKIIVRHSAGDLAAVISEHDAAAAEKHLPHKQHPPASGNPNKTVEPTTVARPKLTDEEKAKRAAERAKIDATRTKSRRAPKGQTLLKGEIKRIKNRKLGVYVSVFKLVEVSDDTIKKFKLDRSKGAWATMRRDNGKAIYTSNRSLACNDAMRELEGGKS